MLAALEDSDAIIRHYLSRVKVQRKSDGTEVTAADKGAEQRLRRHLRAAWPHDPVLGEEYGGELARSGRCWLVDPIDGTASYVLGIPMFGTLLSLLIDGEPVFGVIRLTALAETTYAARGHGCWLKRDGRRPQRVHVGPAPALSVARVGISSFRASDLARDPGPWRLANLSRNVERLRLAGDCVQYALLCRGALDVGIDPLMKPWDIGAIAPCVLEAGGSVSDLSGEESRIVERSSFVAASSPQLRRAVCELVALR